MKLLVQKWVVFAENELGMEECDIYDKRNERF